MTDKRIQVRAEIVGTLERIDKDRFIFTCSGEEHVVKLIVGDTMTLTIPVYSRELHYEK